jgi:hypothetical protein
LKDVFGEFYRPSGDELKRFVTQATIVLDASVLLDLYRLGTSERSQIFDALAKIENRLWIPYQVGLEYQRNRLGVVAEQAGAYEKLKALHTARSSADMKKALAALNLPVEVRDQVLPLFADLADKLHAAVAEYELTIDNLTREHVVTTSQARSADPVRGRLDTLLAGRVGQRPDRATHEKRVEEGVRRSAAKIPPGYKDADKIGDEYIAGDYLLWAQVLDYAKESNRSLLFVTKDTKEDWFERSGSEIRGPRTELVAEFREHNEHGYHQVTLGRFLTLANDFLSAEVDEATIDRVSAAPAPQTSDAVADWQATQTQLEAFRRAGQIQFPADTLEAFRRAGQIQLPTDTLEAFRRAGQIQLPPDTLQGPREALRAFTKLAYWQAVRDAQGAATAGTEPDEGSAGGQDSDTASETDGDLDESR